LVLRSATQPWFPKRVPWLLKAKKLQDMEGTVIGMTWGRRTALGSRHLGRMGALILRLDDGTRLELSGFTDEEREVVPMVLNGTSLSDPQYQYVLNDGRLVSVESESLEGKDATKNFAPAHFPIGSRVTFTYRELSRDGVPK